MAHKTGTLWGVTDDVGIVRLPDGRHLAVAFFVTGPEGHAAHAKLIARMMRTIYDGYSQPYGNAHTDSGAPPRFAGLWPYRPTSLRLEPDDRLRR